MTTKATLSRKLDAAKRGIELLETYVAGASAPELFCLDTELEKFLDETNPEIFAWVSAIREAS